MVNEREWESQDQKCWPTCNLVSNSRTDSPWGDQFSCRENVLFWSGSVKLNQDSPKIGTKIECLPLTRLWASRFTSIISSDSHNKDCHHHFIHEEIWSSEKLYNFPKLQNQQVIELGLKPRQLTPNATLLTTSLCCWFPSVIWPSCPPCSWDKGYHCDSYLALNCYKTESTVPYVNSLASQRNVAIFVNTNNKNRDSNQSQSTYDAWDIGWLFRACWCLG